jgi:hypothetical protein
MPAVLGGERRSMWRAALLGSGLGVCLLVLLVGGQWATAEERQRPVAATPPEPPSPESVIELRFTEQESLFGRGLDARVHGKTVTLVGVVETAAQRALAGRLAQVSGIEKVNNQIAIEPPVREAPRLARSNPPLTNAERERRMKPLAAPPLTPSPSPSSYPTRPEATVSREEAPLPKANAAEMAPPAPPTSAQILREALPPPAQRPAAAVDVPGAEPARDATTTLLDQ